MSSGQDGPASDTNRDASQDASTTGTESTVASEVNQGPAESSRQRGIGETLGRSFDAARGDLGRTGPKTQLTSIIGLFAVVGLGFGLTGIIASRLLSGGTGGFGAEILAAVFSITLLLVLVLSGSIVGVIGGLRIADQLQEDSQTLYLTSFVATAIGYVVMVVIATLLIGVGGGSTGSEAGGNIFDVVGLLVPILVLALPVGLTGVGSSFFGRRAGN